MEDLKKLAESQGKPLTTPLSVGVIPTIGPYLLPRVLPELQNRYPKLKLDIIEDQSAEVLEQLRRGALDEAEAVFARILDQVPEHPGSLHFMGMIRFQRGAQVAAFVAFRGVLAGAPFRQDVPRRDRFHGRADGIEMLDDEFEAQAWQKLERGDGVFEPVSRGDDRLDVDLAAVDRLDTSGVMVLARLRRRLLHHRPLAAGRRRLQRPVRAMRRAVGLQAGHGPADDLTAWARWRTR